MKGIARGCRGDWRPRSATADVGATRRHQRLARARSLTPWDALAANLVRPGPNVLSSPHIGASLIAVAAKSYDRATSGQPWPPQTEGRSPLCLVYTDSRSIR